MSKNDYSKRLHHVIPGGAHTYSRGDDQYPLNAPPILSRGKGAYVWDPDGNKFLDYGMALRAVTLGYDYEPVSEAAIAEIRKGNNLTRATVTELEAAELLTSLFKGADMVKFAKNGSTVTTAAVKLARAYTGRKFVAVCAEHPFFTYDDWFIGVTPMDKGIPEEHRSLTLTFHYNDPASLQQLFDQHPGQIAAVMLEPASTVQPKDNFLHKVKDICHRNGAVFILDEMITGFRWDLHGAQKHFGIQPDLCTFGKGMANGFSLAALAGKREIMSLGGILEEGQERVFLISTTHGAEMCALGAFIKTVEVYRSENVTDHLWKYGSALMDGMNGIAKALGIEKEFSAEGFPCSPYYMTRDRSGNASLEMRTLFSQEMIRNGVLMPWIALSLAHGTLELEMTLNAVERALKVYRDALEKGAGTYLEGRPIRPVFRKHN
ncbi:MAG TPA: glutamate-1-semialdehyde 2,1-aminomutase [Bacteroidia bacterium]|nr:glutamate-1-semialdehyde 2,1-aminomutase [Bacteroidia bacterium]